MGSRFRHTIGEKTLLELFQEFIQAKIADGLTEKTLTSYIHHFESMEKYLPSDTPVSQLTTRSMKNVIAEMAKTDLSRNTIRSYTATMKSFFSWADAAGECSVQITLFKGEETVPETYTEEELKILLKRPVRGCTFAEYRNWVIINLLVNNGVRASTVRAMKCKDLQLESSAIFLRHLKTRKVMTVPLSPTLIRILSEYAKVRDGEDDDPLFPDADGKFMTETCMRSAIRNYNTRRGVKKTSIHSFRHTFARMYLVECGGDALKLQKLLGHSTLAMTKHYVQIFDSDLIDDFADHSPLERVIGRQQKKRAPQRRSPIRR